MTALDWFLLAPGLMLLGLASLLALQALANCLPDRERQGITAEGGGAPLTVVLMPAHDEAEIIDEMVREAHRTLPEGGWLLVIADNCTDDTAARARAAGAKVIERFDPQLKGKGYALAHGIRQLQANPPEVVVVMDADCKADEGSLEAIACLAHRSQLPVQARYDMEPTSGGGYGQRIAAFAWDFRTRFRAEGYRRLGLPCQLMGSGMAFPWPILRSLDLATGHLVEDLKLGLDCARLRHPASFLPAARVRSHFPVNLQGASSQRKRWEHGHLSMLMSESPRLLWESLLKRNGPMLALVLDMSVPPIALLTILVVMQTIVSMLLTWLGWASVVPVMVSLTAVALLSLAVMIAWLKVGRRWISLHELVLVPWYVLRKVPLYLAFLTRRQVNWIKTRRD